MKNNLLLITSVNWANINMLYALFIAVNFFIMLLAVLPQFYFKISLILCKVTEMNMCIRELKRFLGQTYIATEDIATYLPS